MNQTAEQINNQIAEETVNAQQITQEKINFSFNIVKHKENYNLLINNIKNLNFEEFKTFMFFFIMNDKIEKKYIIPENIQYYMLQNYYYNKLENIEEDEFNELKYLFTTENDKFIINDCLIKNKIYHLYNILISIEKKQLNINSYIIYNKYLLYLLFYNFEDEKIIKTINKKTIINGKDHFIFDYKFNGLVGTIKEKLINLQCHPYFNFLLTYFLCFIVYSSIDNDNNKEIKKITIFNYSMIYEKNLKTPYYLTNQNSINKNNKEKIIITNFHNLIQFTKLTPTQSHYKTHKNKIFTVLINDEIEEMPNECFICASTDTKKYKINHCINKCTSMLNETCFNCIEKFYSLNKGCCYCRNKKLIHTNHYRRPIKYLYNKKYNNINYQTELNLYGEKHQDGMSSIEYYIIYFDNNNKKLINHTINIENYEDIIKNLDIYQELPYLNVDYTFLYQILKEFNYNLSKNMKYSVFEKILKSSSMGDDGEDFREILFGLYNLSEDDEYDMMKLKKFIDENNYLFLEDIIQTSNYYEIGTQGDEEEEENNKKIIVYGDENIYNCSTLFYDCKFVKDDIIHNSFSLDNIYFFYNHDLIENYLTI